MSSVPVQRLDHPPYRYSTRTRISHAGFLAGEIVLLGAFLALVFLVKRHLGPLPGDVPVEVDVQHAILPHPPLAAMVEMVSTLNWPIPSVITLAIVTAIFLLLKRWLDIIMAILTAAVTDESSYLLNTWVHRPRPAGYGIHVLASVQGSFSFPSGHVVHATAVFGLFLFFSSQIRRPVHPALIWLIRLVLLAAIVLMPISRVLEGEHWPSDALAGLIFGAFWLAIAAHVYLWARSRWPRLLARDER